MTYKQLILFLLLLGNIKVHSQRCGEDIYIVKVFSLVGKKIENLKYEIFELDTKRYEEIVKSTSYLSTNNKNYIQIENNYRDAKIIYLDDLSELVREKPLFPSIELQKLLEKSALQRADYLSKGILQFRTREMYSKPYLLKISSGKKCIYIIDNFFGGCYNEKIINWE